MRPELRSSYPEGHCSSSIRHAFFLLNSMKSGTMFYWESRVRKNTSICKFLSSDTSTLWFPWMELVSLFPSSQPSDYNFFFSEMLWCLWTLTCRDFRIQNKILVEQERRSREHCLFVWRNFMAFLPSVWLYFMKLLWEHFISVLLFLLWWACSYYFSVTEILFLNMKLWLWEKVLYPQSCTRVYITSSDLCGSSSHIRASVLGP